MDQWFQWAKEGGAYVAPFLLGALIWLNIDRARLIAENKEKDDRLIVLAERIITLTAELKTYLFSERKA